MIYLLSGNLEKTFFQKCIETQNVFYPTINFTVKWLRKEANFLDFNVRLRNRQLETDLHIKPADIYQIMDSTFCHPYHCKKSIPCNLVLRYNKICSENENFDQRYNGLEKWLMERGYSERMVRTQICRGSLFE